MHRRFVIVNGSSTDSVCFRTTFLVGSLNESYILDNITSQQRERIQKQFKNSKFMESDEMEAARQRAKTDKDACPDLWLNYIEEHKLPTGWENGTPLNYWNEQVAIGRKVLNKFQPNTVKDCCLVSQYLDKVGQTTELTNSRPYENNQFLVTTLNCLPLNDQETLHKINDEYCSGPFLEEYSNLRNQL
ncbi:hypothetical protein M3Y97_00940800 [Aphelenchoides bicaudatus]|nr:hypothetical protein M3Y97_00940800 [Aphelenchoides bicaudatus]